MKQGAKILSTIGVIVLFMLLFVPLVGVRSDAGAGGPGIIGLILFAGMIGAIRAIWKSESNDD